MGRKCVVPNCNSGYASCKEKVITFKVPSDPVKLQAWARAIPRKDRELTSHDYVCEKHFSESDIERRRYYGEFGGEVLLDKPKRPVLLPDAVPSIFPHCPSYLSLVRKKRRPIGPDVKCEKRAKTETSLVRDTTLFVAGHGEENDMACPVTSLSQEPNALIEEASNGVCVVEGQERRTFTDSCGAANAHTPIESSTLHSPEICLLHKLIGPQKIVMPSATWSRQDIVEGAPSICFVQLKKATPTTPVFVNKSLELTLCKSGVKVTECVLQREVSTTTVKVCTETQPAIDITQTLEVFHKKPVCRGGPTQERFPGIKVECASVDATGFWRHTRCPILLDGPEDQCFTCLVQHSTSPQIPKGKAQADDTTATSREPFKKN